MTLLHFDLCRADIDSSSDTPSSEQYEAAEEKHRVIARESGRDEGRSPHPQDRASVER